MMHFCFSFLFNRLYTCECCVCGTCTWVRAHARARTRVYVCDVTLESDFVGSTSYLITEYKLESEVRLSNCGMTAPRRRYFRKDASVYLKVNQFLNSTYTRIH